MVIVLNLRFHLICIYRAIRLILKGNIPILTQLIRTFLDRMVEGFCFSDLYLRKETHMGCRFCLDPLVLVSVIYILC